MKKKYNIIGACWNHYENGVKNSSILNNATKYVEWVTDGSAEETFYVDQALSFGINDKKSLKKYGWIYEPTEIYPNIFQDVKNNYLKYVENYDAIFTFNKELLELHEKFKPVYQFGTWIIEPKLYKKTKLVSMISSNKVMCLGHLYRLKWVEKLKDKVDLYGIGFNPIPYKEDGLKDYMFSVAIENCSYETYFSEKIQDCFATGTIPIYYGAPDIGKIFNSDGIITLTDDFDISILTPELYYDKLDAVKENFEIIKNSNIIDDYLYLTHLHKY